MVQVSLLLITPSNAVDTEVSALSNWLNFIVFLFVYIILPKFCQHFFIRFLCSHLILKSFYFFVSHCFSRKLVELGRGNIKIFRLCFKTCPNLCEQKGHTAAWNGSFSCLFRTGSCALPVLQCAQLSHLSLCLFCICDIIIAEMKCVHLTHSENYI